MMEVKPLMLPAIGCIWNKGRIHLFEQDYIMRLIKEMIRMSNDQLFMSRIISCSSDMIYPYRNGDAGI